MCGRFRNGGCPCSVSFCPETVPLSGRPGFADGRRLSNRVRRRAQSVPPLGLARRLAEGPAAALLSGRCTREFPKSRPVVRRYTDFSDMLLFRYRARFPRGRGKGRESAQLLSPSLAAGTKAMSAAMARRPSDSVSPSHMSPACRRARLVNGVAVRHVASALGVTDAALDGFLGPSGRGTSVPPWRAGSLASGGSNKGHPAS